MPRTKEEMKEYRRQYYLKNKENLLQRAIEYQNKNKEKKKEYDIGYHKKYCRTEKGKKKKRINQWKGRGILCFDFDLLYDIFLSTNKCEFCNCELYGRGSNKKCLDHDHNITDKFNVRGVLCHSCNIKDVLS